MIGIVGGVGPYAGLDLMRKVFDNTRSGCDQDHVDTLLFSLPSGIADRTEYLEGRAEQSPADAIVAVLAQLAHAGATVAGIPCNSAHAGPIFDRILDQLQERGIHIRLLHMVHETAEHLGINFQGLRKIGVLCTTGAYRARVYQDVLEPAGYEVVMPPREMQEQLIHPAIYDQGFGIKSASNPVHPRALGNLETGVSYLGQAGVGAVILGCTEISMVFNKPEYKGVSLIDPAMILARALIQQAFPEKLKVL